ncbi:hypothetical protein [Cytobacillus sp. NCCP-133]|uniref:hypothetical protein n=1 Tax=Cytobacillus sp. NCCP-133 TaxID=766848 RepID=UPI0022316966|nr:hypothetical protein [Cytobacillus sp. NCCP-133]GLB59764.1 hypothetical protein NCCP133_18960 [Cytobacillus sp. NCCP-133]
MRKKGIPQQGFCWIHGEGAGATARAEGYTIIVLETDAAWESAVQSDSIKTQAIKSVVRKKECSISLS